MRAIKLVLIAIFLFTLSADAARLKAQYRTKNLKGQSYYLNNCSSCHGDGNRGGNMASIREWKKIFSKDAQDLKFFHEEEQSVLNYLNSKKFEEQRELMLKFLQEFAYDSEFIPTCN